MGTRAKGRGRAASSVRQSVTIPALTVPAQLAAEVRRIARQRHLTVGRALVALAEKGVEAEAEAREELTNAYQRFMSEGDADRKNEAGKELIRAIFGKTAICRRFDSLIFRARSGSTCWSAWASGRSRWKIFAACRIG